MDSWKKRWGVGQWAAFFETQELPVMPRSKWLLGQIEAAQGEMLSAKDLSTIVLRDPLLCLRLLREAERAKSHRLDRETTTALAAIMQLGVDEFHTLLLESREIEEANAGLVEVETRATTAAEVAQRWAMGRRDLNPEEVAVAALLADTGELLLWVYAPELPEAARDELLSGRARRSSQAQQQACGFDFKLLTMRCAEQWKLPLLVVQLLRGIDTPRANITRICSNVARHLMESSETATLALASDLLEVQQQIPGAALDWLADGMPMLAAERRGELVETAERLRAERKPS